MATGTGRGRPRKAKSERAPTVNFTMRLRPSLLEDLRQSAEKNERSISAEAERRLSQPEFSEIARMVSLAINAVETNHKKRWYEDDKVKRQCRAASEFTLNLFLGAPSIKRFLDVAIRLHIKELERAASGEEHRGLVPLPSPDEIDQMLADLKDWSEGMKLADQFIGDDFGLKR